MQQCQGDQTIDSVKCQKGFECDMVCISQNCNQAAFSCSHPDCNCLKNNHRKCSITYVSNLLEQIQQNRLEIPKQIAEAISQIDNIYLNMMDKLSELRQQLMNLKKNYGLTQQQTQLLNSLSKDKRSSITGKAIKAMLRKDIHSKPILPIYTVQQVKQYWQTQVQQIFQQCCRRVTSFAKIGFPLKSQIVTLQQEQLLRKFLNQSEKRNVDRFQLLYRASQKNFSTLQFHKKCDGRKNTLIIALTQFDKVIGGYTPVPWASSTSGQYKVDKQCKTFIFSLSNKEKYDLIRPSNAIFCRNDYGPTFGAGYDIHISNMANSNSYSFCDFPHSFNKKNNCYTHCQQSYSSFNGAILGCNGKIKNWEVFKVRYTKPIAEIFRSESKTEVQLQGQQNLDLSKLSQENKQLPVKIGQKIKQEPAKAQQQPVKEQQESKQTPVKLQKLKQQKSQNKQKTLPQQSQENND